MSRDYNKAIAEDRRFCVLRTLEESPGYKANEGVLQATLEIYGHACSRDGVSAITNWLEEGGLVTVEALSPDIRVVAITGRGQEVATGRAGHPGVRRPRAK